MYLISDQESSKKVEAKGIPSFSPISPVLPSPLLPVSFLFVFILLCYKKIKENNGFEEENARNSTQFDQTPIL